MGGLELIHCQIVVVSKWLTMATDSVTLMAIFSKFSNLYMNLLTKEVKGILPASPYNVTTYRNHSGRGWEGKI